jgi:hypothetical protein
VITHLQDSACGAGSARVNRPGDKLTKTGEKIAHLQCGRGLEAGRRDVDPRVASEFPPPEWGFCRSAGVEGKGGQAC